MFTNRAISGIIYFATSLLEGLITIRIVLKLLGASTASTFVTWLYVNTDPLLAPFVGIFPSIAFDTLLFESSALVALIVYAFVGYLLAGVFGHLESFASHPKDK